MKTTLRFRLDLWVDERALRRHASRRMKIKGSKQSLSVADLILASVLAPNEPPETCGYVILPDTAATPGQEAGSHALDVRIEVNNTQSLVSAACRAWKKGFPGDTMWRPRSLTEAAYVVLVECGSMAEGDQLGFEVIAWDKLGERRIEPHDTVATTG